MFNLNSTLNFGIPLVLVFQLEVYYKVDKLLTGLTAQPKGTIARWYSNKTSLRNVSIDKTFYYWNILDFEIMLLLLTQLEVYYNKHEPLTGLTAEQSATTVRWNLNKTTLLTFLQAHPIYIYDLFNDT